MNQPEMSTTKATKPAAQRFWRRLSEYLRRRIRLRRSGLRWRLVLEPTGAKGPASAAPRSRPGRSQQLPPMPRDHASAARRELRALLDHAPGTRRVWPSLALIERVLGSDSADDIHRVEAAVLRHATRALDQLGDEVFGPGLVVLRRRLELILRRKHGDRPSHWARMPPPPGADRSADSSEGLTDYLEMDRPPFAANRHAGRAPPERRAARVARRGAKEA